MPSVPSIHSWPGSTPILRMPNPTDNEHIAPFELGLRSAPLEFNAGRAACPGDGRDANLRLPLFSFAQAIEPIERPLYHRQGRGAKLGIVPCNQRRHEFIGLGIQRPLASCLAVLERDVDAAFRGDQDLGADLMPPGFVDETGQHDELKQDGQSVRASLSHAQRLESRVILQ